MRLRWWMGAAFLANEQFSLIEDADKHRSRGEVMKNRRSSGFSLPASLIVVYIIAILASSGLVLVLCPLS